MTLCLACIHVTDVGHTVADQLKSCGGMHLHLPGNAPWHQLW